MVLKTAPEISPKLVWVNLLVMVLLAVESCTSANFEGVTPGNGRSHGETSTNNAGERSFSLGKKTRVYGFPRKPTGSHLVRGIPLAIPPTSSAEEDASRVPAEGTSRSTKPVIPDEGGIVHITFPTKKGIRAKREMMGLKNRGVYRQEINKPDEEEISTKKNSNSITIPEEGGPIYIDVPDYVTRANEKRKINPEDGSVTLTPTDSGQVPGKGDMLLGSGDMAGSTGFENLTKVAIKETGAITSKQNSAGAGAVASKLENITSNGLANIAVTVPGKGNVVSGNATSMENLRSGNVTQVLSEETSGITSEPTVSSIYIGSSDYPFFAAIHSKGNGDISFDDVLCSGGIVSEVVVVTSCSCLFADEWPAPPLSLYYVTVGHLKNTNINATPVYRVGNIKYHPSCDRKMTGLWKGNIVMLMIAKPGIEFGKSVQPMNLPKLKMWDASDVLAKMSDQRRRCRVIGWSRHAPLVDTAIGQLIPLDECVNPVCKQHMPCPERNTVDGFMVEITPNEPSLLPGALLYCSEHVFAIVNTKRQCGNNHVFAACSPEELLYTKFNFELTPEAQRDMAEYNNTFSKSIEGWETFIYPSALKTAKLTAATPPVGFADIASSGAILFPFYVYQEPSWIYTYVFAAGYYGHVF